MFHFSNNSTKIVQIPLAHDNTFRIFAKHCFRYVMLKSNFSTKKMQSALYVILLLAVIAMMMSIKRCSSRHSIKIAPQTGIVTIDSI